jgi:hypothetical protein
LSSHFTYEKGPGSYEPKEAEGADVSRSGTDGFVDREIYTPSDGAIILTNVNKQK